MSECRWALEFTDACMLRDKVRTKALAAKYSGDYYDLVLVFVYARDIYGNLPKRLLKILKVMIRHCNMKTELRAAFMALADQSKRQADGAI